MKEKPQTSHTGSCRPRHVLRAPPDSDHKSEVAQSCPTLCGSPMDCSLPSFSMVFSRQEYWSGLPFSSPGDLPDPGIEPRSLTLQADALLSEPPGKFPNHNKFACKWRMQAQSLGREDPLEKRMITHSSILARKISWTEESGRLQTLGSQRVGHD